jgi:hypothetical protein
MSDKRPFIIFGIAALLILTIFIIFRSKRDRYSWVENYEETNKSPYGTFVVYNLLKDYFPDHKFSDISNNFLEDLPLKDTLNGEQSANFIFIGEGLYLDTSDVDQLLDFVEAGNTAFISSKSIPYDLMYYVYSQDCNGSFWYDYIDLEDTLVSMNLISLILKKGKATMCCCMGIFP